MPNSNIKVMQIPANTSMDYQGKILKEYFMLLNMLSQQTPWKCKWKFLSYLLNLQLNWTNENSA